MARKIKVCGKELYLTCSMHAFVSYETMTGESALALQKFQDNQVGPVAELGYCMLLGCNNEKDIPKLEELLRDMDSYDKMQTFMQAVSDELREFFPPIKSPKGEQTEDAEKNA